MPTRNRSIQHTATSLGLADAEYEEHSGQFHQLNQALVLSIATFR